MVSISNLIRRGNDAIKLNPPGANVDIHLTDHGSDWLWAAFSVFSFLTLVHVVIFALTPGSKHSLKKFLTSIPLFTNAILAYTYFTYASNLGWTSTPTEFHHVTTEEGLDVRQIFYVKYIGWFCAYPFALFAMEVATNSIELNFDSNSQLYTKLFNMLSGYIAKLLTVEIFVLGYLIGGLIKSTYKWGYWVFGTSGLIFTMALITVSLVKSWNSFDNKKIGSILVILQLVVWLVYPVCWGLSEGGNRIQPDSEAVFYGILDLITFGFIPSLITFSNNRGLDDGFFQKLGHFGTHEKEAVDSPRASGETAV